MSQRLLETDFPSAAYKPQIRRSSSRERPPNLSLRPVSTSGGTMPKNYSSASEWQYEPSLMTTSRTGSMSRVQTSFAVKQPQHTEAHIVTRTGSLRKAFTSTTSDEDEEETRPLHRPHNNHNNTVTSTASKTHANNSQSSTSDYHSDENPNLLPVEHRELPSFRLNQLHR